MTLEQLRQQEEQNKRTNPTLADIGQRQLRDHTLTNQNILMANQQMDLEARIQEELRKYKASYDKQQEYKHLNPVKTIIIYPDPNAKHRKPPIRFTNHDRTYLYPSIYLNDMCINLYISFLENDVIKNHGAIAWLGTHLQDALTAEVDRRDDEKKFHKDGEVYGGGFE